MTFGSGWFDPSHPHCAACGASRERQKSRKRERPMFGGSVVTVGLRVGPSPAALVPVSQRADGNSLGRTHGRVVS